MRRVFENNGRSLPVPFSEDCIFYAPLTESDLTDWVGGTSFILTGDGSMTWDSSLDIYHIATPSSAIKTVANITRNTTWNSDLANGFTVYAELARYKYSGINSCRPLMFSNIAINSEQTPQWHGNPLRTGISIITTFGDIYKCCKTFTSVGYISCYINGAFDTSRNEYYDFSNMGSPQNQGLTIGCAGHTNFVNCHYGIRNIIVYKRALTASEVAQL